MAGLESYMEIENVSWRGCQGEKTLGGFPEPAWWLTVEWHRGQSGLEPTEMAPDPLPLPFLHLSVTAPHQPVFKAYFTTESEGMVPLERKDRAFGGD
jgi:hypothetical protein